MTEHIYSDWLITHCAESTIFCVKNSEGMVKNFLDLDKDLPDEYRWRFSDVDSIAKQSKSATSLSDLNRIFWTDQARNIEAYAVMTWWRANELVRSCLNGLNAREVIVPAVAARSLLELSTVFLLNANKLEKNFKELTFIPDRLTFSNDLEKLVAKLIWGTRYQLDENSIKQTNIMSSLEKLAKSPGAEDLMQTYEFLCDIAHPSFIGNTSFWSHVEATNPDGSQRRLMSRLNDRNFNTEITDKTLWALGWSATCIYNAFIMTRNANVELLQKL
ncbi:TPA: hypothetical protein ACNFPD_003450 [Enterobacter cancerogenus]